MGVRCLGWAHRHINIRTAIIAYSGTSGHSSPFIVHEIVECMLARIHDAGEYRFTRDHRAEFPAI